MNSTHNQLTLPMLTYYQGPELVDASVIEGVKTYREAVRLCWLLRKRKNLTKRMLAEEAGLYASHVNDYLSESDTKRELPARYINKVELACGNRAISQWVIGQASLTILETLLRKAA